MVFSNLIEIVKMRGMNKDIKIAITRCVRKAHFRKHFPHFQKMSNLIQNG